ncbi:MAG: hypothetical protein ABGF52_00825 [Candidatus Asgardarchaeum sp.]
MTFKGTVRIKVLLLLTILVFSMFGFVFISPAPYELEIITKSRFVPNPGDYDEHVDYFFIDDVAECEGYLYICGYRSNPMWPFLAKFNDNGSIEWYRILKIYGNVLFRYMGLITVDKAGYAYFLTTRTVNQPNSSSLSNVSPVLLKIAPNSTIVWEKIIGVAVNITWFYSINYMHDDTILILGKSPSNEIVLTKLTLNGEIIWSVHDDVNLNITNARVALSNYSIYVFVEGIEKYVYKDLIMIKYSNTGHKVSSIILRKGYVLSTELIDIEYSNVDNETVLLFDDNMLYKVSPDGLIKFERNLSADEYTYYGEIAIDNKGNIYAVKPSSAGVSILKLDRSLNIIHTYFIEVAESENEETTLAHRNAIFIKNDNLYLFLSVGKINYHIWAVYLKLREQISPLFITLSISLVASTAICVAFLMKMINIHKLRETQHNPKNNL